MLFVDVPSMREAEFVIGFVYWRRMDVGLIFGLVNSDFDEKVMGFELFC